MNSYINRLTETKLYLEDIQSEFPNSVLWEMLHRASWHYKIDWIMWIDQNKDFIQKIKSLPFEAIITEEIRGEFYKTVEEIIKSRK
ncbi:hypothetical protein SAMN05444372_102110 [Flavobacterium micromati]|jgi:endoglucanase Acf2|uniref:Uncharacterized protein n=1 Tax=Flavobacterium micromati TaxID=229205 RepID=A0A1M5GQR6_9FLAO|nr:hypothetical protein [Flavobacterium micromati]SHG06056.1 hypothetical protein SAMN05444372_102110 [Flavobacterium micromati]